MALCCLEIKQGNGNDRSLVLKLYSLSSVMVVLHPTEKSFSLTVAREVLLF
jgi:hypothetical protein